jgi:prepilin-type N-terminal cleavage/methylation domain-containing protein
MQANPRPSVSGRRQANHRHQAFTLIELLVVISVIALLVALLLPALSGARISAFRVQSLSNLRMIQFAVFNYAEDNKTSFPLSLFGYNTVSSSTLPTWTGQLFHRGKYVSTLNVYWSPIRDRSALNLGTMKSSMSTSDWYYTGYAMNLEMTSALCETTQAGADVLFTAGSYHRIHGKHPLKLSQAKIPPPAKFLMTLDGWSNVTAFANGAAGFYSLAPGNIWNNPNAGTLPINYNGSVVYGFLDGHAVTNDGSPIGWSCTKASPTGAGVRTLIGPYAGNWTWTTGNPVNAVDPFYQNWRVR